MISKFIWVRHVISIRKALDKDATFICELHIESIKHFCQEFYSSEALEDWIVTKKPSIYRDCPPHIKIIVAENGAAIIGFGVINLNTSSIDSVYIKPGHAGKGIGTMLLHELENIAREFGINQLKLDSTLNATEFYKRMGYKDIQKKEAVLLSGTKLPCFLMSKIIR